MKHLVALITLISVFFSCTNNSQEQAREAFVRSYFQRYPQATLQDIYKGSF